MCDDLRKDFRKFILILTFIKCKVEHIPIHMQAVQHRYSDTRPRHDNMKKTWDSNQKFRNRESPTITILSEVKPRACGILQLSKKIRKVTEIQRLKERERERFVSSPVLSWLFDFALMFLTIGSERERERRQIFINKMYRFPARVYLVTC